MPTVETIETIGLAAMLVFIAIVIWRAAHAEPTVRKDCANNASGFYGGGDGGSCDGGD
ncbi:hypothetical protein [Nitratireductor basaltis]|uniref:hypothetical protein n=1 Tax=Nitratireductor basaltis TaxID=472175 RepID=UPI000AC2FA88|nr:hypothetical protein [Nitratireductor basaltis]